MATFGIRVNAAVNVVALTSGTFYTAPANGYAILNFAFAGTNQGVAVGGQNLIIPQAATPPNFLFQVYVGPGQACVAQGTNIDIEGCGVEFVG